MRPNLQFPADLVTFTEISNGKLHFLYSAMKCVAQRRMQNILEQL